MVASTQKRTRKGAALTELILEVFRVNTELLAAGNELTAPHGLTSARWQVMGAIHLADQPLTVAQIARRMGLARQGVLRIVGDLAELGFLELQDNVDHKRAKLIILTSQGKTKMSAVDAAQIEWVNALSDGLNVDAIEKALSVLTEVRERLESAGDA